VNKHIRFIVIIVLTAVICISGYQLWKMSERYVHEARVKESLLKYRLSEILTDPAIPAAEFKEDGVFNIQAKPTETIINQFVINMQNEINTDIIGWLTVPDTKIDYPFVTALDNDYYLRRDVFGNHALSGTLYMDYRCSKDFSGFNSIIYGHNMKNGSMFGELNLFGEKSFFDENKYGTVFLKDHTYTLEFFAYIIVKSNDEMIYDPCISSENQDGYFEYIKNNARNYREPSKTDQQIKIATLSTCLNSSGSNDKRIVLLAVINETEKR